MRAGKQKAEPEGAVAAVHSMSPLAEPGCAGCSHSYSAEPAGPEDVAIAFQVEQQLAGERHSAQLARMQQELHHAELRRLEESLSRLSEGPAGKSSAGVLNLIKELMQNPVVGEAATWVTTANIEPTQPDERAACEALRGLTSSIKTAASPRVLLDLLQRHPAAGMTLWRNSVSACVAHVTSLAASAAADDGDEIVFGGWAVYSYNEWGWEDQRVLVVSSKAIYRCQFNDRETPHVSSRIALEDVNSITAPVDGNRGDRGLVALDLRVRDGRRNPLTLARTVSFGRKPKGPAKPSACRWYAPVLPVQLQHPDALRASMRDLLLAVLERCRLLRAGTEMKLTVRPAAHADAVAPDVDKPGTPPSAKEVAEEA